MRLEVCRQIDDVEGTKGAFLRTDTTADAESLGDEGDLGFWRNLNAELPTAYDWARLFAFLTTFLV